jgi:hypothetical protein
VANRKRGRGGRSRKRRPSVARTAGGDATDTATGQTPSAGREEKREQKTSLQTRRNGKRVRPRGAAGRSTGAYRDRVSVGERPQAPWHPLPLSELLILVGAIGVVIGLGRGISHGVAPLSAGIVAVLIGTVEVTLREHLSGYRSHTLILTLLPLVVFHSSVVLIVASLTKVPKLLNVVLLLVDAAIGAVLFKLLRARHLDGRRERTFAGRR